MLAQLVLATPRPLIGIYPTVGHSPGAYDEYQSWLSAAGADSRVLPTTFTGAKLEPLFQSLNGFLIPGGGDPFGESVDAMVRRAVRANEGGDYFPVWGTCLGFEWLTDIFGGSRSTIDDGYDSEGLKLPLTFTAAAAASRTYAAQNASVQHWLATEPLTYNLHHEGIEPPLRGKQGAARVDERARDGRRPQGPRVRRADGAQDAADLREPVPPREERRREGRA